MQGQVAYGGHDPWPVPGADLAMVFGVGDVADVVQVVLAAQVPTHLGAQQPKVGPVGRHGSHHQRGLGGLRSSRGGAGPAGDLDRLGSVREVDASFDRRSLGGGQW